MAKITYKLIAEKTGLSIMSVSNALRHPNEVRPSTLNKVQNAIIVLGGEIPQPHRVAMKRVVSHRPHRRIRFITGNIPLTPILFT
jgi:hypothetical protein